MHDDVVIVGGGLAGMTAALAAAREGADVRLLSYKENTLRSASGLIDVLGYLPASNGNPGGDSEQDRGPLSDPFAALGELPDDHPYSIVGESAIRESLAIFDEITGDTYRGGHTDANALLPTFGGTLKPTTRYPRSAEPGLVSRAEDLLLVGFDRLVDFDAPVAADHLAAAGVPFEVRGVTVDFPGAFRADAKITRYVHALERNETLELPNHRDEARPAREALATIVGDHIDGEERVGFPAILGDDHPEVVREDLEAHLGVDVFEVPMGPPSMPGLRLQDTFETALRDHGVRMESGNPAVGYETNDDGNLTAVLVDRNGKHRPYHANQFVLATGGLVGKGIETDRETAQEPVFDCHVDHPPERYEWFSMDAFGDHEFARFGVRPDGDLRPTDEALEPEYTNLRAAGAVIGGYDFAAEKSGSGVSLATGYAAGTAAARDP